MKPSDMFLSICRKSELYEEVLMEKKKYVLLPILIVCFLISGGCGSTGKTAKAIQNIDTQTADDNIFY